MGADILKQESDDAERGSDIASTPDVPLSTPATNSATIVETVPVADRTTVENGGTRYEGPHDDVHDPAH